MSYSFRTGAVELLKEFNEGLHYKQITKILLDRNMIFSDGKHPENTVNSILNTEIKLLGTASLFLKHPNKPGYFLYNSSENIHNFTSDSLFQKENDKSNNTDKKINTNKEVIKEISTVYEKIHQPTISSHHKGKGGEMAVSSELLFRGFNTSIPNVDDGIDLIGVKHDKFFYFQVKTSLRNGNYYPFSIKCKSFDRFNIANVFYIFVMRKESVNVYLIIHNTILSFMIDNNFITKAGDIYTINISNSGDIWKLGTFDITQMLNNRDSIK